ncbi:MAG: peptidase M13 [Gammaproteobacteria bacterium]|nr:peptidase M13 [Gammaproteobacteria bacterium]MBQ0839337.1 peptidase M13 [Gammaproteobacteria bacterium]
MKKQLCALSTLFGSLLCLLLISGCDSETRDDTRKPSGLALQGMDVNVRPQDDFFAYANGRWMRETKIPNDKSSWGSFSILHEKSLDQLQLIIQQAADNDSGDTAQQAIGNYYKAFLDTEAIINLDLAPLATELVLIEVMDTHADVATFFARSNASGIDSPLNFWVDQDAKDSTKYIVYLTQSGLGLPDRDYYFDESERGQEILQKYRRYIEQLMSLAKAQVSAQTVDNIIAIETALATAQWTKVENRDSDKTYNKLSTGALQQLLPDYHLDVFLDGLGIGGQSEVIVRQPTYAQALNRIFTEITIEQWQDYLRFKVLNAYAAYLPEAYEQLSFDFYQRTLSGQPEQQPRWKRAVNSINSNIGELLGQLYVAKHFPPEAKARMLELVDQLIAAYRVSIGELEWMSPATRTKALEKLASFTPKIGYPDKWKDYSSLEIKADELIGNIRRANQFNQQLQIAKLGKPVDRSEWFMAPQKVNAYYNPGMNEIVFPAAILQPPFFDINADDAVNYGGIGGVIGHEIGHGFDDQGSKYTGEGNLENWWTDTDRQHFEQRTLNLIKQYAAYEPLPGLPINGELTLGENIGDLGGLSIALKAYELSLQGKPAPMMGKFSGEQRVFLGWAQAWRVKRRPELTERLIKTDPHSPPEFRVNGVVPNIDAFYSAFDVKEGDKLYLPPAQRVRIW